MKDILLNIKDKLFDFLIKYNVKEKLFNFLNKTIYKKFKVYHLLIIWLIFSFMNSGAHVEKTYYQVNKNGKMKDTKNVKTLTTYKSKSKSKSPYGMHGPREYYFENGQLATRQYYKNGFKDGVYEEYSEDGRLIQKGNYVSDGFDDYRERMDGWWINHSNSGPRDNHDLVSIEKYVNSGNYDCEDGRQAFSANQFREIAHNFEKEIVWVNDEAEYTPSRWISVQYKCGLSPNKSNGQKRQFADGVTNLKDAVNGGFVIYEWYEICCFPAQESGPNTYVERSANGERNEDVYKDFLFINCCGKEIYKQERQKLEDQFGDYLKENKIVF